MSEPCDHSVEFFNSNDPFDKVMKKYLLPFPGEPGQTILNLEAIVPMPLKVRGTKNEEEWMLENWGGDAECFMDSTVCEYGLQFATRGELLLPAISKLAVVSGYDLQCCYYASAVYCGGELIAYADGTEGWTGYNSPWETPQWLLGQASFEPCEEEVLWLEKPIPAGWGRALTASELRAAEELFGGDILSKLFVRRSLPDRSGCVIDHQPGRVYAPTKDGGIQAVGFAEFF